MPPDTQILDMAGKKTKKKMSRGDILKHAGPVSRAHLLVVITVFALVGGYVLLKSFASTIYYISATGSDANPCSQAAPCATFQRAYQVAQGGDSIAVNGGSYRADYPSEGALKLKPDAAKSASPVSFVCGDGQPVTFAAGADQFVITAQHIVMRGSCFKFNRLWVGDAPNGVSTQDVTIDGVSMMMFDISGSDSVTIQNSQVGPDIACYAPPVNDGRQCQNNAATNEKYFFDSGRANTSYVEPMVHFGGAGGGVHPTNIQLLHNHFIRLNSRDINGADGLTLHTSCLFLQSDNTGGPIMIDGNKFEDCMNIDTFFENGVTQNVTLQNNMFGYPVNDVANGSNLDSEAIGAADVSWKCFAGGSVTNILVRYNTFTHGPDMDSGCSNITYTNVRLIGNILGEASQGILGCKGNTIDYNIVIGGTCGTNSLNVSSLGSLVTARNYPIDFHLINGTTPANNFVTPTGTDYALATDYDSQTRSAPRTAGADVYGSSSATTPTVSLSASPSNITAGSSSTLTWTSANATSCSAVSPAGWTASTATSGSQTLSPVSTTTYSITCTGASGSASANATVNVSTSSGTPSITSISPTSGPIGSTVIITGTNLTSTNVLEFNQGGAVSYTINSSTQITATVPAGSQTGYISINQGQALSPQPFTVTASSTKPGDLNGDNAVNITDLSILLSNYNTSNTVADINKDGIVNVLDLSILLSNYGT